MKDTLMKKVIIFDNNDRIKDNIPIEILCLGKPGNER